VLERLSRRLPPVPRAVPRGLGGGVVINMEYLWVISRPLEQLWAICERVH